MIWRTLVALLLAGPVWAQGTTLSTDTAVLRGLDKVSGQAQDIIVRRGEPSVFGRLRINLRDCRYPADNQAGDAYAGLEIWEEGRAEIAFSGWMIASAPALSALDHPRYDIWVLRCATS